MRHSAPGDPGNFDLRPRGRVVGAVALILSLQYLVAEAVTALGWTRVPYSYAANYISDLGVPECFELTDRTVCSPWHVVMNIGFVAQGLLMVVALLSLGGLLSGIARWLVTGIGALHAVGITMVGLFPGSVAESLGGDETRMLLHSIGALLAIAGGNLLAIATGVAVIRRARGVGIASIGAGVLGLLPLPLTSVLLGTLGVGGVERLMVYPFIFWMIGLGVALLVARRRHMRVTV